MLLENFTLEMWRTIFLGIQTAAVVFASVIVTVLNLGNPEYSKNSKAEYLSREKRSVFYKGSTGAMPITEVGFAIKNKGIGIGKINKIEIVEVVGGHIDADKERFAEPEAIDGHRLFPLQRASFKVTTDLNKDEFSSIELLIHDKKLGKQRIELDCAQQNQ